MYNGCPGYYKVYVKNDGNVDTPIECTELIKALIEKNGLTGYQAFLYGNIIKYLFRINSKESIVSDSEKAKNYIDQLVEEIQEEDYKRKTMIPE